MASETTAIAGRPAPRPRGRRRASKTGKLRLRRSVPLRDALIAAFSGALLSARRAAGAAAQEPERSVHDFRKSIRRARSVVALLRPSLGKTAARGLEDELRRAFSGTCDLRDRAVLTATLAGLAGEDAELFVEAAEFAARLETAPAGADPAKILREALAVLRPLPAALEVTLPRAYSTPDLQRGVERGYRRAARAFEEARRTRRDAEFHVFRKRVKEHRYQLELLASTGSPTLKAREKPLAALARELGEVTDLAVLCTRIEALPAAAGAEPGGRLLDSARATVRRRADELLERGAAYFAEAPRAFALKVLAERG